MEEYKKSHSTHHAPVQKVQNTASLNKEGEEWIASERD